MTKLYIVDDDMLTCNLLHTIARPIFKQIEIFKNPRLFLKQALKDTDIVILDLMMPDMDGIEVIRHLAIQKSLSHLVLISGYDSGVLHSAETLAKSHGLKVIKILTKPISTDELTNTLLSFTKTSLQSKSATINKSQQDLKANIFTPSERDLQKAIENKELVLYYQPQITMKTEMLSGAEALVRWLHPEFGLIYPDKFIALAESTGLIEQLTEEVIHLAIAQSLHWQKMGKTTKLSINISAQNITSLKLPEQLKTLVKKHELDPSMIVLELTESGLMGSITTSLDILTRLRLKGFQLSIDDFGTGFSSLSLLHKVPFTELKVDQSFVANMTRNNESKAIVETCIMLGHKLNMEVVAEGIEDKATWNLLLAAGCDIGQGYYIAKPMPALEFEQWQFKV